HPDTGGKIQAALGPYGPYVVHDQGKEGGKDYRSLKSTDNVLTITLERALELLSQPKAGRGGSRSKTKEALRELGNHPEDGEPINIYNGPYGPYIKHGKTNASIPEGESVEAVTLEKALELLAAKASTAKSTKSSTKSSKSTTTKKSTTSKAKTTKTAASKTTTKTTATKKKTS
ncbi:MAG TPA: DNA topoisomerase I, partial [Cyanobacteria bacterium UBA11369]|nr:DNA topoisomerase I [Cyanobacteria bacterium UBA11369]